METQITSQQEDFLLDIEMDRWRERQDEKREEQGLKKCDFCCEWVDEEELSKTKIDNGEQVNLCESCKEGLKE